MWALNPGIHCPVCGAEASHASTVWAQRGRTVIVTIQHPLVMGTPRAPCVWTVSAERYMAWEGKLDVGA